MLTTLGRHFILLNLPGRNPIWYAVHENGMTHRLLNHVETFLARNVNIISDNINFLNQYQLSQHAKAMWKDCNLSQDQLFLSPL